MSKWKTVMYQSGTHIVTTHEPKTPWLYIYHPERYKACKAIESFMNGGEKPSFIDSLVRTTDDSLQTDHNDLTISISATGWMELPPDDNGALRWRTCNSAEANKARKDLIDIVQHNIIVSPIGKYGSAMVLCDVCGYEHVMVYPVPIKIPSECPKCGNMSCYFIKEASDD